MLYPDTGIIKTEVIAYYLNIAPTLLRHIKGRPLTLVRYPQLKLAVSLIESMQTSLDDIELKDQYQDAVREMIQAKIEGKETVTVAEEEPQIIDIMAALKQSIEQSKSERKPMAKAKKATQKAKKAKKATIQKAKVA